jgi:molybdate transport system ATP-binding protein
MSHLYADIHKRIGRFELDVMIGSDARRIGVLGASGSGKSMTLKCLAGIEDVDYGRIETGGRVLFDSETKVSLKPQKRNVGYMFQNYALFPTMTVLGNVMAGLRGKSPENRETAMDMLRRFGMDGYENRLPGELSGGQQQRVALARIMVTEPDLILLDEPYSALDGYLRDRMQLEMLEMLEDYDGQVIMVSHSRDELYRFSEELFVLDAGRIIRHGAAKDVFSDPGCAAAARLTGCKNISAVDLMDDHTALARDWGMTLKTKRAIPSGTKYIGYRAHSFEAVWGEEQDNCVRFDLVRSDDLPFEKNLYIRTQAADPGSLICWFIQGDEQKEIAKRGYPDYLKMKEENMLFLK